MKFLIDENIRKEVIEFIKDLGYDVLISSGGTSDEEVAKIAQKENRIILTHDIHFANILIYPPNQFPGIIRIRIHPPNPEVIISSLKNLFQKLPLSEIDEKLVILEEGGFRIREE